MTDPYPDSLNPFIQATCPACGYHMAIAFYTGEQQPLATLGWPASAAEAHQMEKLPLTFVRCLDCGHIYNQDFEYSNVPYSNHPNLMYNKSVIWQQHLDKVRDLLLAHLPAAPVVIEIGCGEGDLLRALAEARPEGRYIGFDPNIAFDPATAPFEARQELFVPEAHLPTLAPDILISRHVLEHLSNPLAFIQGVSCVNTLCNRDLKVFIEVPCVDKIFTHWRIEDFYYEHNSHFTSQSFRNLLSKSTQGIEFIETSYGGEVIYGLAHVSPVASQVAIMASARSFTRYAAAAREAIPQQLQAVLATGIPVVIWGGTGKGAAFMNYFGVTATDFPWVVDSDQAKVGTCVPGLGQTIRLASELKNHPPAIILIATQWRAKDIVTEIQQQAIPYQTILLEHQGRLVDYWQDPHPYR